jgi:hypothetical protein
VTTGPHPIDRTTRGARLIWPNRRSAIGICMAVALPVAGARAATRHRLVMVEAAGCIYCVRWHAEVGPGYARSAEGAFAPLQRFDLGDAGLRHVKDLRYTPTFVLLDGNREVGRIVGYPGADFFWGLLTPLLAKAGFPAAGAPEIKT